MKKMFFSLAFVLVFAGGVAINGPVAKAAVVGTPVTAVINPSNTIVTGTVMDPSNAPLQGANVSVTCLSANSSDVSDSAGGYVVYLDPSTCPDGSTVTVTATKGDLTGVNSGTVDQLSSRINLALVDVQAVPEIGTIGALSALALGGGAIAYTRRRQAQN